MHKWIGNKWLDIQLAGGGKIRAFYLFPCVFVTLGMRKERGNYRNPQMRRATRLSSAERHGAPGSLGGPAAASPGSSSPLELTPEQLIGRIMEAEPPEIYLTKDMKRPLTEANVMMSLTNLADKELVHMISWAKKIPGTQRAKSSRKKPLFFKIKFIKILILILEMMFYLWNRQQQW